MTTDKKTEILKWVKIGVAVLLLILRAFGIDIPEELGAEGANYISEIIILILGVSAGNDHQKAKNLKDK